MKKKEDANNWLFFVSDSTDVAKWQVSRFLSIKKRMIQYVHPTGLSLLQLMGKDRQISSRNRFSALRYKNKHWLKPPREKSVRVLIVSLRFAMDMTAKGNQFVFNVTRGFSNSDTVHGGYFSLSFCPLTDKNLRKRLINEYSERYCRTQLSWVIKEDIRYFFLDPFYWS